MNAISHAELLHIPIYEVEITEDSLAGTHVYVIGSSLQMKAAVQIGGAWTSSDVSMHDALVMEDDNPAFALREYTNILVTDQKVTAFSLPGRARPSVIALAKDRLIAAGITPPEPAMQLDAPLVVPKEPAPAPRFGKPLATPKEDAPEALTVDLIDTSWDTSGSRIVVYVKVRNTSGIAIRVLRVTVTFEQQNNSIVSTEQDIMEPMTIEPNGTALAKLSCRANPLIHHYNLTFENADFKEVKFKNRTK